MKTMSKGSKHQPDAILIYEDNITDDELMEILFTMLDMAAGQAGYRLTINLWDMLEKKE